MKVKLINNESGFSCEGCIFIPEGNGANTTCNATIEALKIGDCSVNTVFVEEVTNDTAI